MKDSLTPPPAVILAYHVTIDRDRFQLIISRAITDLAKSGRRCDMRSISEYLTMLYVLRECVTITPVDGSGT